MNAQVVVVIAVVAAVFKMIVRPPSKMAWVQETRKIVGSTALSRNLVIVQGTALLGLALLCFYAETLAVSFTLVPVGILAFFLSEVLLGFAWVAGKGPL